jgi:hypothetical protein
MPLSAGWPSNPNSIEFLAHEFLECHVNLNRRHPAYVQRVVEHDVLPPIGATGSVIPAGYRTAETGGNDNYLALLFCRDKLD